MKRPTLHPDLCRRIGFGCGRLVGGSSFKESALLLETAAELGIRYFDVAPSYGLGSAERVLGEVLGGDTQFEIATKVGISRPKNATLLSAARSFVAPVVRRVGPLKQLALSYLSRQVNRQELNNNELLASFEESLHLLKRDSVDVLFLHEAIGIDNPETRQFFEQMYRAQKCRYFGAAISAQKTDIQFGNAVQMGFGPNFEPPNSITKISVHGVVRADLEVFYGMDSIIKTDYFFNKSISNRTIEAACKILFFLKKFDDSRVVFSFKDSQMFIDILNVLSEIYDERAC